MSEPLRYQSWCQSCVWKYSPCMMTGYCLKGCRCDKCGQLDTWTGLAMIDLHPELVPARRVPCMWPEVKA